MASIEEVKKQKPLRPVPKITEHYKDYTNKITTATGFLEFQPRDMQTQMKYDAMSDSWQGIQSSNDAIARGDFALDSAVANRDNARQPPPQAKTQSMCSIS